MEAITKSGYRKNNLKYQKQDRTRKKAHNSAKDKLLGLITLIVNILHQNSVFHELNCQEIPTTPQVASQGENKLQLPT